MTEMNLDQAPGWLPDEGDVLVGEIVDISKAWSDYKEGYYPIVTIKPEGPVRVKGGDDKTEMRQVSIVAVHGFHTVLFSRLVELRPEVGERIGIKFVSQTKQTGKKGKDANSPALYNVKIDGRSADVWDVMAEDPRVAQARQAQWASLPVTPPAAPSDADDDIPF